MSSAQKKYIMLKCGSLWAKMKKTIEEKEREQVNEVCATVPDELGKLYALRLPVPFEPLS